MKKTDVKIKNESKLIITTDTLVVSFYPSFFLNLISILNNIFTFNSLLFVKLKIILIWNFHGKLFVYGKMKK